MADLYHGDNLPIMCRMPSASVDLIYCDPPFCTGRDFGAYDDRWTLSDVDEAWHGEIADREPSVYAAIDAAGITHGKGMKSYLIMMAVRLLEMRRVLKDTGSVYLHCDPTASHYLKLLMDGVFGVGNFRNEIVWHYRRWTAGNRRFQRMHDVILWYGRSDKLIFNVQFEPYGDWIKKDYKYFDKETGKRWRWHTVKGNRYKVYLEDENRGVKLNDVWRINHIGSTAKERVGYPTQKPLALLERIIKASSNEGDMVLDPFCGCGTTLVAADRLGRRAIGMDASVQAVLVARRRLERAAA